MVQHAQDSGKRPAHVNIAASQTLPVQSRKKIVRSLAKLVAEINRIGTLQKPSWKSRQREQDLRDTLSKSFGMATLEAAESALASARRGLVAGSINDMVSKAARRDKSAAQKRVRAGLKDARDRVLVRRMDARRKIIIGGTIAAAIRDGIPEEGAIKEMIRTRASSPSEWSYVEPLFASEYAAGDEVGSPSMEPSVPANWSDKESLARAYRENQAKRESARDVVQAVNGEDRRQRMAGDARRKIIVGGAILKMIGEEAGLSPALLSLLDKRIGSQRDREAVRAVLPLAEFRPQERR